MIRRSTQNLAYHDDQASEDADTDPARKQRQAVPVPDSFELYRGLRIRVCLRACSCTRFGHGINKPKSLRALEQANLDWFSYYIWGEPIPKDSPVDGTSELESNVSRNSTHYALGAVDTGDGRRLDSEWYLSHAHQRRKRFSAQQSLNGFEERAAAGTTSRANCEKT